MINVLVLSTDHREFDYYGQTVIFLVLSYKISYEMNLF